ncbi:MAG: FAD:protein FMN transferase [Erysipelotrichaceae bacterium]|nr:FAD:protein FMN transferase [Erysipelotrichaceae bacterium]
MIKKMMSFLLCLTLLTGCQSATLEEHTLSFTAMNTYMSIRIYGGSDDLLQEIKEKVEEIDATVSVTNSDSEIYQLNHHHQAQVTDHTWNILSQALPLCQDTDGALDLSIYPVVKAWGFTTKKYRVPSSKEIKNLLQHVDYRAVKLANQQVTLKKDMAIDLGSVTKGYTTQLIIDELKAHHIKSAIVDFGGNVHTLGHKTDGSQWTIGVKAPETGEAAATITINDLAVITSGGYERYFEENGHIYCHIIDPHTGYPVENGVSSVTIIGDNGLRCDALSTALFVKGKDKAIAYYQSHHDFDMIIMTNDHKIYVTPDFSHVIKILDPAYTLEVISDVQD